MAGTGVQVVELNTMILSNVVVRDLPLIAAV
jgi:hypothetical protein